MAAVQEQGEEKGQGCEGDQKGVTRVVGKTKQNKGKEQWKGPDAAEKPRHIRTETVQRTVGSLDTRWPRDSG